MHEFKPKVWMKCPLCNKQSPMPDPDHGEWVTLTDDELLELYLKSNGIEFYKAFARNVEAKLREKNNGS